MDLRDVYEPTLSLLWAWLNAFASVKRVLDNMRKEGE